MLEACPDQAVWFPGSKEWRTVHAVPVIDNEDALSTERKEPSNQSVIFFVRRTAMIDLNHPLFLSQIEESNSAR